MNYDQSAHKELIDFYSNNNFSLNNKYYAIEYIKEYKQRLKTAINEFKSELLETTTLDSMVQDCNDLLKRLR